MFDGGGSFILTNDGYVDGYPVIQRFSAVSIKQQYSAQNSWPFVSNVSITSGIQLLRLIEMYRTVVNILLLQYHLLPRNLNISCHLVASECVYSVEVQSSSRIVDSGSTTSYLSIWFGNIVNPVPCSNATHR